MNFPNLLTLIRIFCIPALVAVMLTGFPGRDVIAFSIFVFASLTDWFDGYWARKKQLVTVMGQLLDPIADKLLITSALICLVWLGRVPPWAAIIIIGRELAVTGFRSIASSRGLTIPASSLGKAKMGVESWVIAALILGPTILGKFYPLAKACLWLVIALAVVSAAEYCIRFGHKVLVDES